MAGRLRFGGGDPHIFKTQYISAEGMEQLRQHKYNSVSLSIIYKHVGRPMSQWMIEYVPKNIAPNVLTVGGLAFTGTSFIFARLYCPNMTEAMPSWIYFMFGLNLFTYVSLDMLDGLQARRTGTSGPLGQLMDHGCDCVNTVLSTFVCGCALQLGPEWMLLALAGTMLPFYTATWSEYHTGVMFFDVINGADEGVWLTICMYIITAFLGPQIWVVKPAFGLTLAQLLVVCLGIGSLIQSYRDYRRVEGARKEDLVGNRKELAGERLLPIFVILSLMAALLFARRDAWGLNIWVVYLTGGFTFAIVTCHMILTHMTHDPFPIYHQAIVPLLVEVLNLWLGPLLRGKESVFPVGLTLWVIFGVVLAALAHYAVMVTKEICEGFEIHAFVIGNNALPLTALATEPQDPEAVDMLPSHERDD